MSLGGGETLIDTILGNRYILPKYVTYKGIRNMIEMDIKNRTAKETLDIVKAAGAHVLLIQCRNNGSKYYQRFMRDERHKKFICAGGYLSSTLPVSALKDFFEELYVVEDAKAVAAHPFKIEQSNCVNRLKDISGKYHNAKNGA